jgi:tripartite-type tricarboxylate transporter receptor subunit TctC
MRHIPYKGRAQAIPDLLGGRVQMSVDNLSSALPLIRAGEIKAIGVTSANRSSTAPEIPSLSESGVPQLKNFHVTSWFSLMGPSGMSKEDILKITAETKRIFNLPEVKDRLLQLGLEPNPQGPAALKKLIQADSKRWSKLIQETGIKAE